MRVRRIDAERRYTLRRCGDRRRVAGGGDAPWASPSRSRSALRRWPRRPSFPTCPTHPRARRRSNRCPTGRARSIERPGDQDWYTIVGRNADDSINTVFVRVLQTTPTCAGPLKVALFNPERRWMRSSQATRGNVATMLVPRKPSRYLVDISSTEPACAGLEYEITYVNTEPPTPDSTASKCLVARAKRIDAKDRLTSSWPSGPSTRPTPARATTPTSPRPRRRWPRRAGPRSASASSAARRDRSRAHRPPLR